MVPKVTSSSMPYGLPRFGELSRTSKIALAALGLFALGLVAVAIRKAIYSGRGGVAAQPDKRVNVYAHISGNPTHLGHMHMIGLAVKRLVEKGYLINQVKVELGDEAYIQNKVGGANLLRDPQKTPKAFVAIPLDERIKFLRAAIQQAKKEGLLEEALQIDYSDRQYRQWRNDLPFFQVCGVDFTKENPAFISVKHAVVVTRDEQPPKELVEEHRDDFSRLIVRNEEKTRGYSSSKIQDGAYHLLPESVRERFKELHQAAQAMVPAAEVACPEEITNPIARETAIAIMNGFYISPSGNKNVLRSGAVLLEGSRLCPNTILEQPVQPRYDACEIVVRNQDCLEAAEEEQKKGKWLF